MFKLFITCFSLWFHSGCIELGLVKIQGTQHPTSLVFIFTFSAFCSCFGFISFVMIIFHSVDLTTSSRFIWNKSELKSLMSSEIMTCVYLHYLHRLLLRKCFWDVIELIDFVICEFRWERTNERAKFIFATFHRFKFL